MKKLILSVLVLGTLGTLGTLGANECKQYRDNETKYIEKAEKANSEGKLDVYNAYYTMANNQVIEFVNCKQNLHFQKIKNNLEDITQLLRDLKKNNSNSDTTSVTDTYESTDAYGTGY